jgi:hypothetical protein
MYNKFRVSPKEQRTCDGIVFASKREMKVYQDLALLKKAKKIKSFELQPVFELLPKPNRVKYIADFKVINNDGSEEIWDVKGFETPDFKIKKKMMTYFHPKVNLIIKK